MDQQGGFTLLELMVTVAMAAIVLTTGVPGFQTIVKNNRLTTATNGLVGALGLARSEAVKRGVRVTVCKSADGAACISTGDWSQGWIAFTDLDSDGVYDPADSPPEIVLRVQEAIGGNLTMVGNGSAADHVFYTASGFFPDGVSNATIAMCDDRSGNVGKNIVLSKTGRVRLDTEVACP